MAEQVKICYKNILETSTVTVTTENTSFPKYRLYDRDISKLFKGTGFASPFAILLGQGAVISYEVDRLIIPARHNLNGLACSLRYSTDNFSADDHEAVGWTQGDALLINKPFTAQTKQYWKLNIPTGPSLNGLAGSCAAGTLIDQGGINWTTAGVIIGSIVTRVVDGKYGIVTSITTSGGGPDDLIIFAGGTSPVFNLFDAYTVTTGLTPELTEIFLGKTYTFQANPLIGSREGWKRNLSSEETESGLDRDVKLGESRRYRDYELSNIESAQKADFESWEAECQGVKPFWVIDHYGVAIYMKMLNELEFTYLLDDPSYGCILRLREVLGQTT